MGTRDKVSTAVRPRILEGLGPTIIGPKDTNLRTGHLKWEQMGHISVKVNLKPPYWHLSAFSLYGTAIAPNRVIHLAIKTYRFQMEFCSFVWH